MIEILFFSLIIAGAGIGGAIVGIQMGRKLGSSVARTFKKKPKEEKPPAPVCAFCKKTMDKKDMKKGFMSVGDGYCSEKHAIVGLLQENLKLKAPKRKKRVSKHEKAG